METLQKDNQKLDAFLAEEVMEWIVGNNSGLAECCPELTSETAFYKKKDGSKYLMPVSKWNPTKDIVQALEVIDELGPACSFTLKNGYNKRWRVELFYETEGVWTEAETRQEAICYAVESLYNKLHEGKEE